MPPWAAPDLEAGGFAVHAVQHGGRVDQDRPGHPVAGPQDPRGGQSEEDGQDVAEHHVDLMGGAFEAPDRGERQAHQGAEGGSTFRELNAS